MHFSFPLFFSILVTGSQSLSSNSSLGPGSSCLRWDLESAVRGWIEEGSTMIGSWPEPLRDSWKLELKILKDQLVDEIEKLKIVLEEVNFNFNSYKSRAQTGKENRNHFSCNCTLSVRNFKRIKPTPTPIPTPICINLSAIFDII